MPLRGLCSVYLARLSQLQQHHYALLDDVEAERRGKYKLQDDRDRFTLGAALLRIVVAQWTGLAEQRSPSPAIAIARCFTSRGPGAALRCLTWKGPAV